PVARGPTFGPGWQHCRVVRSSKRCHRSKECRGSTQTFGCHRPVIRGCNCQQGLEWHRDKLESPGGALIWLHGNRNGQKIEHFETVRVAKSGERVDVSISISPVRDERGNIVGAAKIARDIR